MYKLTAFTYDEDGLRIYTTVATDLTWQGAKDMRRGHKFFIVKQK